MIDAEELAICKRREHVVMCRPGEGWAKCEKCGTWIRDVVTREERDELPPEDELSSGARSDLHLGEIKEQLRRRILKEVAATGQE